MEDKKNIFYIGNTLYKYTLYIVRNKNISFKASLSLMLYFHLFLLILYFNWIRGIF